MKKFKVKVKKTVEAPIEKYLFDIKEYKIVGKEKKGAYGIINFVKNKKTGVQYAAKTNLIQTGEQNQEFILREIGILINVQHPTIVQFQGVSFQDLKGEDNITILMDYKENGSLAEILSKEMESVCPHNYDNTKRQIILVGIARGMNLLHNHNVIHRDLKPENILLDKDFHPCITDFGLSKFFDPDHSKSQSMSNCGTIGYMAPEIIQSNEFNIKADVYAFGILMYELLSGTRAYKDIFSKKSFTVFSFHSKVIEGYRPQFTIPIKNSFKKLIEKCWSQDIDDRPTFSELFKKLSLQDKSDTEDYCLDDVDVDELSMYVDDITCNASSKPYFDNDESSSIEMKKLKKEILKLKEQNEQIQLKLDEKDEKIHSLKKKNSALRDENEKIKDDSISLKEESVKIKEENLRLKNENKSIKKENKKLKEECGNFREETIQIKDELLRSKETINKLQEENNKQKKIINDLNATKSIPSQTFNIKKKEVDSIWDSNQTKPSGLFRIIKGDSFVSSDSDILFIIDGQNKEVLSSFFNFAFQISFDLEMISRRRDFKFGCIVDRGSSNDIEIFQFNGSNEMADFFDAFKEKIGIIDNEDDEMNNIDMNKAKSFNSFENFGELIRHGINDLSWRENTTKSIVFISSSYFADPGELKSCIKELAPKFYKFECYGLNDNAIKAFDKMKSFCQKCINDDVFWVNQIHDFNSDLKGELYSFLNKAFKPRDKKK